jgi:hypothetical protein
MFFQIMSGTDHHFRREDRASHWLRIAGHVERHPDELDVVLANLDRWEQLGRVHLGPIREWRRRILAARASQDGMRELLEFLAAVNHDAEPIKSCSPFVGLSLAVPVKQTP